jgi:hypothetical protein
VASASIRRLMVGRADSILHLTNGGSERGHVLNTLDPAAQVAWGPGPHPGLVFLTRTGPGCPRPRAPPRSSNRRAKYVCN